ncbi:hypothetical protein Afil01_41620 [Actinorhabdospora filicis]|uniref:Capsule synthesis protein CapA domain-containing protein n=1 Tax=Actinorhabdospora filicis TaxID=1785913 RepID=A0A9W6WC33_9ACTN|nr:CapA family protein [Actinorhabdospora filicis]GLZ79355.1 hypothetical protein Afil01_41620 [Actinorhabdospora filicis]
MARRRPRHAAPPRFDPRLLGVTLLAAVIAAAGAATVILVPARDASIRPGAAIAPTASVTPESAAPPTITITGTGDIIMGSAPDRLPAEPEGFFDAVAPALAGDLLSGNFEGALTEIAKSGKCGDPPVANCDAFRMPPEYARVIAEAGFDVVNLANNHTLDYGTDGLADTREAFSAAGVEYTGMRGQYAELTFEGVRVAVLGVSPYSWSQDVHDIEGTAALVEAAGERNDLVVVNMQAGGEGRDRDHVVRGEETFLGENRGDVVRFAHAVIDAGADLVLGHGPHVLRGMEFYKGRLIAYSLGNFAGYRVLATEGNRGIGATVSVTLAIDGTWVDGVLHATRMTADGRPALDPDNTAHELSNRLSRDDFAGTAALVTEGGRITPP